MRAHRSVYPHGLDLMLESSLLQMPVPEGRKQAGWKADSGDSGALSTSQPSMLRLRGRRLPTQASSTWLGA